MSDEFTVSTTHFSDSEWHITTQGEIDMVTAPQFQDALNKLTADKPQTIGLNLGGVTFFDSSGIRVLVEVARQLDAYGGKLVLLDASQPVRKVLEISGVLGEIVHDQAITPQ